MLANELIPRSLKLINIPGRGATLHGQDMQDALEMLQDILNSEAVSKQFVPGIRRHFFTLSANKSIYSYGRGGDFDTDDFDDDPPIRIEDGYVRAGSSIDRNEQVDEWNFVNTGTWSVGSNWIIANQKATATGAGILAQTLGLTSGKTYIIRVEVFVRSGDVLMELKQDGTPIETQTLTGSATYDFPFSFAGTTSEIVMTTDDAGDDLDTVSISILEDGLDRVSLPDVTGSDYHVDIIDQSNYNRQFSKGIGGRPYRILYSRNFPNAELRFDNSGLVGDILVMDVLTNRVSLDLSSSVIRMHADSIQYVKYKLADHAAGTYGKSLTPRQIKLMDEAYDLLAAGNRRINTLGVDLAMRSQRDFDINRGDP